MKEVRALLVDAILAERERCARIADRHERYWGPESDRGDTTERIASEIRSANPPQITVVRPETAVADPSKVTPHTIIAGQGLVVDEIVDRFRMRMQAKQ